MPNTECGAGIDACGAAAARRIDGGVDSSRSQAGFGRAAAAVLVLPGVFAGVVPPLIARFDPPRRRGSVIGLALIAAGVLVVGWCVRDFYVAGKGTLAPWDPPRRIVVVGLYRSVRNPMYLGVLLVVAAWAVLLGSPAVGVYALLLAVGFHLRVVTVEEPSLARMFGGDWEAYARDVGRWVPRGLRPRAQ